MGKSNNKTMNPSGAPLGGTYFLTFIGSAVYFVQQSDGFWGAVGGILQGAVWPAFLIHRALELMHV